MVLICDTGSHMESHGSLGSHAIASQAFITHVLYSAVKRIKRIDIVYTISQYIVRRV